MHTLDNVLSELKRRGFKNTKYRSALLALLFSAGQPISVQELLEKLSLRQLDPNKTTVYRELSFLIDQGLVAELDLGDEKKRYELAHLDHHHHIICTECRKIMDIVLDEDLSSLERKITSETKFKVTDHTLEFFGLCKDCQ